MDFPFKEELLHWLLHYGPLALFVLLGLGIVGLPIPDETLLVISGFLLHQKKLGFTTTFMAAYGGALCGITLSYFVGKWAGKHLLKRFGPRFFLSQEKLEDFQDWYARFGKWSLFFGYFIPGVRHLTGFFAGMANLKYKDFALFSYSGGIVWVSFFLSIGYFLHHYWTSILLNIESNVETFILVSLFLLVGFWYYKNKKPT